MHAAQEIQVSRFSWPTAASDAKVFTDIPYLVTDASHGSHIMLSFLPAFATIKEMFDS